jgi:hypothetical protein
MTEKKTDWTLREVLQAVDRSSPRDFDGHVDFMQLSFEDQLRWISRSARMVLMHGKPPAAKGGKYPGSHAAGMTSP